MTDALSVLASSTAVPPSPAPPRQNRTPRHHPSSTGAASKSRAKPRANVAARSPLILSSRRHNRQSVRYSAELASKLVEDGRFDDFVMIGENVISSGVSASEFVAMLDVKSVAGGIARMVGEGTLDAFLEGARSLGIEPVEMCDGAVLETIRGECRGLLDRGDVARLASLLETLAGYQFRLKELVEPSDVINLCIIKRDPVAAIRCTQVFPHAEILFCSVILEFGKKCDLESALAAFEESKKYMSSPNMHMYRTVIDVCGLCRDYLKSRTIYEELLASGITPNLFVVNSLMNVNASDLSYTLHIYKQMEKLGVTADITSRNILLKSCSLSRNIQLSQEIYQEMRKLEVEGTLKLDVFTYSTMIKVLADFKMWKAALEVKEDMMSSGVAPNTVTWSSLISACANAGVVDQATKLFDEMLEAGGQPNALCFNSLLHACVEARQFDRAFRLFESWRENSFQKANLDENRSNSNAALYKSGSHLTRKIPFRPTISTYNILMKACGTDYYRVKALMDEMKTLGLSPNHISWSILMDICGAAGNVMGAVQILKSMREIGIQPDVITYTTAIKICVEHNNPKLAYSVFAEMEKYQIKPNMVTFNTLLRARRRYGSLQEVQQCLAIYQRMRKAGYKPNDYYLKQLIEEWCEGVMHNEDQKEGRPSSSTTDFGPQSLLLEKVAEHLHESNAESFSINLRGLSKLEARIVVLAVLRKIKEMYVAGSSVKDDLLIILGLQELGALVAKEENGLKEAIVRLLQHDLGLQVFSLGSRTRNNVSIDPQRTSESPTRRPVVLQRLKVTKESLHRWLQRKIYSSTTP